MEQGLKLETRWPIVLDVEVRGQLVLGKRDNVRKLELFVEFRLDVVIGKQS